MEKEKPINKTDYSQVVDIGDTTKLYTFKREKIKTLIMEKERVLTDNSEQCCGICSLFIDEDVNGDGWCEYHQEPKNCSSGCEDGLFRTGNDLNVEV